MSTTQFSKGAALQFGWDTFKQNAGFLLLVYIVGLIVMFLPDVISGLVAVRAPLVSTMFTLLGFVVTIIVSIGLVRISLNFVDGRPSDFADLYQHYQLFLPVLFVSVLYGLLVAVGVVLLVVPGIILAVMFYLCDYLVIDQGMKPMEALRKSAELTRGHRTNLFLLTVVIFLINLAGAIALGVGLVITFPVTSLAAVHAYRQLVALDQDQSDSGQQTESQA